MSAAVKTVQELKETLKPLKEEGRKVVFTNGCFDLIHPGHVAYLAEARNLGDLLVVGLNSDDSVKRQGKGPGRPIMREDERAEVLGALKPVDYVVIFDEDTPLRLISEIVPDVLVKGGDWALENIVGRDVVEKAGGTVRTISYVDGKSTTDIVGRVLKTCGNK